MDGNDGTREDTEDTTILVQTQEVKNDIGTLPFVTKVKKLSPVDAHKDKEVPVQLSFDRQTHQNPSRSY